MSHPTYHLPDPQYYAVEQERQRHTDALYRFGEYAMFLLMWQVEDHDNGLVGRCPKCYLAHGKMAEAYGQPAQNKCRECFGTTFEGGYKARLVRPSLWDANEQDNRDHQRGEVEVATASVQTTADFRLHTGDHLFRADGSRWQMRTISTNHLRTGFEMPNRVTTPLGYNFGQVVLQDETAPAYLIPPTPVELRAILDPEKWVRYPQDFSEVEDIRGPLR